jgi:mevalonate pyrophosphate decarboxylase
MRFARVNVESACRSAVGKASAFRWHNKRPEAVLSTNLRDSPCYYLTSVAKDRLSVFRTDEIKSLHAQH